MVNNETIKRVNRQRAARQTHGCGASIERSSGVIQCKETSGNLTSLRERLSASISTSLLGRRKDSAKKTKSVIPSSITSLNQSTEKYNTDLISLIQTALYKFVFFKNELVYLDLSPRMKIHSRFILFNVFMSFFCPDTFANARM